MYPKVTFIETKNIIQMLLFGYLRNVDFSPYENTQYEHFNDKKNLIEIYSQNISSSGSNMHINFGFNLGFDPSHFCHINFRKNIASASWMRRYNGVNRTKNRDCNIAGSTNTVGLPLPIHHLSRQLGIKIFKITP
jgi:hypothetical protein